MMKESQQNDSPARTLETVNAELDEVRDTLKELALYKQKFAGVITTITDLKKKAQEISMHAGLANSGILEDTRDKGRDYKKVQKICDNYTSTLANVTKEMDNIKANPLFKDMNLLPQTRLPPPSQHPTQANYEAVVGTVSQSALALHEILKTVNMNITDQSKDLATTKSRLLTEQGKKQALESSPQAPTPAYRGSGR